MRISDWSSDVCSSDLAEGSLQAQQATNQLLALTAKQQFQLQHMMAAQFRSEAVEQARRATQPAEARAATKRFLGSGSAYTPDYPPPADRPDSVSRPPPPLRRRRRGARPSSPPPPPTPPLFPPCIPLPSLTTLPSTAPNPHSS